MLKRVSIQNFKSLKDVTLDLQKVNLLIGPNNSGKTNFLKALESFSISGLFSQSVSTLETVSYKHKRLNITYQFDYEPASNGYMVTNYPDERVNTYHVVQTTEVNSNSNDWGALNTRNVFEEKVTDVLGDKIEGIDAGGYRHEFVEFLRTHICKPDPSKLVHQVRFSADQVELLADCSNLTSFFFYIDANYKRNSARIQSDLSRCIPEIAYFTLPPVKVGSESMLALRFFDREDNGYWADEVSEGTLYFLALLCIINQPNPPKLLLLEEPEKGIHPRRIREVMDFIFRLAEEKDVQIILTTHNEHVLDDFATRPESVFVFDKDEEGATYVRNLQTDIIEPTNKRNKELGLDEIDLTTNLSENWLYGLLGGVPSIP